MKVLCSRTKAPQLTFKRDQPVEVQFEPDAPWERAVYLHKYALWRGPHAVRLERAFSPTGGGIVTTILAVPTRRIRLPGPVQEFP